MPRSISAIVASSSSRFSARVQSQFFQTVPNCSPSKYFSMPALFSAVQQSNCLNSQYVHHIRSFDANQPDTEQKFVWWINRDESDWCAVLEGHQISDSIRFAMRLVSWTFRIEAHSIAPMFKWGNCKVNNLHSRRTTNIFNVISHWSTSAKRIGNCASYRSTIRYSSPKFAPIMASGGLI